MHRRCGRSDGKIEETIGRTDAKTVEMTVGTPGRMGIATGFVKGPKTHVQGAEQIRRQKMIIEGPAAKTLDAKDRRIVPDLFRVTMKGTEITAAIGAEITKYI